MLAFSMLDQIGSLEDGIQRINKVQWNISIHKAQDRWVIFGGDKAILITDQYETAQSFLYGMALAYGTIPDHIFDQVVEYANELI